MVICLAVASDGTVDPRWGRAHRVAVAAAAGDTITDWEVFDAAWDTLHDTGPEGAHHARVARFLGENRVTPCWPTTWAGHGPDAREDGRHRPTRGVGDARQAVVSAAA
jgi:hypothetical protein